MDDGRGILNAGWSGENAIEFNLDCHRSTVTFTQKRFINKIISLSKQYPAECDYQMNKDGSLIGHIPTDWIHISNRHRDMTDEQRTAVRERLRKALND